MTIRSTTRDIKRESSCFAAKTNSKSAHSRTAEEYECIFDKLSISLNRPELLRREASRANSHRFDEARPNRSRVKFEEGLTVATVNGL